MIRPFEPIAPSRENADRLFPTVLTPPLYQQSRWEYHRQRVAQASYRKPESYNFVQPKLQQPWI
ncbi:MAG: hypothetical protein MUF72_10070 [Elainella sp. Prado103]|nr:hypothetical protein [Elainella sp. Prado103]